MFTRNSQPGGSADRTPAVAELARRDDILELLFWMRGQGFADSLSVNDVARFLTDAEGEVKASLERLVALGGVERDGERYRLSAEGLPEARRRFVDDFREMLADGHGECNFSCGGEEHDHAEGGPHPGPLPEGEGESR